MTNDNAHIYIDNSFGVFISHFLICFIAPCHASYAREDATVTAHDVNVSDNEIARGSVMFFVSSTLYTYRVNFSDSTKSPDLSAVQSDHDSTYIAEETIFVGFKGEVSVIYV